MAIQRITTIEQTFGPASAPWTLKPALARVSTTTWLFLSQIACYFGLAAVGHSIALSNAVALVGVLLSILGIYSGIRDCRKGSLRRGLNCAAVSMTTLLFWSAQMFINQIPIFR